MNQKGDFFKSTTKQKINSKMRRNRSSFTFPDFSLRRFLLQARAARGSPTLGNRCDIEKGGSSTSKGEKSSSSTSSNKVSFSWSYLTYYWFSDMQWIAVGVMQYFPGLRIAIFMVCRTMGLKFLLNYLASI